MGGEVYVVAISDDPHRFDAGSILIHADGRRLEVEGSRRHRARLLVKFRAHDDRAAAEDLRGPVYVEPHRARALAGGEFWQHDLVGCRVTLRDGSDVGSVERVQPGAAQDLLIVATRQGERMVPMVEDFVISVEPEEKVIVIDPPPGLLE